MRREPSSRRVIIIITIVVHVLPATNRTPKLPGEAQKFQPATWRTIRFFPDWDVRSSPETFFQSKTTHCPILSLSVLRVYRFGTDSGLLAAASSRQIPSLT